LDNVNISEIDIHSQFSFSGFFALLKYYKALNSSFPQEKVETKNLAKKPLFKLEEKYLNNRSKNDYVKDLFYSLKDNFNLISKDTKLSQFRNLFTDCELTEKIEVIDSKKLVAIIKFLKNQNIIQPHYKYMVKITKCFYEPNEKEITVTSLGGSKHILNFKEEIQIKNLFNISKS
jgi:hypothetical protein